MNTVTDGIYAGKDLAQSLSSNPAGTLGEIASGFKQGFIEQTQKSTFDQTRGAAKVTTEIGAPIATGIILKGLTASTKFNLSPKIIKQMEQRGWTQAQIQEAINSGEQISAFNKANGNPSTRYVSPSTGQSVVVDNKTGQVIHVGGKDFEYGPASGDIKK